MWGRVRLPAFVDPYVPAVMEALLAPFYWTYKVSWDPALGCDWEHGQVWHKGGRLGAKRGP